jgi:hypothetical protein
MYVAITFHPNRGEWREPAATEAEAEANAAAFLAMFPADTGHTARVEAATLDDAYEIVQRSHEAEGEQRAEYGSGAVSLGYNGAEAMAHYDGYRASNDPLFNAAKAFIAANAPAPAPAPIRGHNAQDDIPF